MQLSSTESTFLNMIKAPCIEQGTREKILPSVMAALAICISDWGTTKHFYYSRNVFMLPVYDGWYGKCYSSLSGKIYDNPKECPEYGVPLYCVYSDHQKSVNDFISYMGYARRSKNGPLRYGSIVGCTNYKETIDRLVRAGFMQAYLNKPDDIIYIDNLKALIERYKLYEWDETLKGGK